MQVIQKTAIIIGAGFAGIGMGIRLKEMGIEDFVIIEVEDGPGGTWRVNNYPGAACDVQSYMYSFSFEPNPNWSRMFGGQDEILKYQEHCCEKYELYSHCVFNCMVNNAEYNEETGSWLVQTDQGVTYEAQFLISGTGGLSKPFYPKIKGLDTFKGDHFHSARWEHDVSLKGKRVAVVGSGASAIQIVPAIVDDVEHLDYYQRTPSWVLPRPDREISEVEKKVYKKIPVLQKTYRSLLYTILEARGMAFIVFPKIMSLAKKLGINHIHKHIKDPELRKKVTPAYEMGCKRILMSNEYYQAISREDVEVITDTIASVDANGITTTGGQYREVDTIVYCTGFYASENVLQFSIMGKGNKDLNEVWAGDGQEAYLGTTVSGFPNLFIIVGPNTGLGHNSMIYMIESQVNYIESAIKYMRRAHAQSVDVYPEVQTKYNQELQKRLKKTIWKADCKSWYLTESGKNTTLWPGFTFEFRAKTYFFKPSDYEITKVEKKEKAKKSVILN